MGITIDKSEVLRYLGYRGQALDSVLDGLIDDTIARCLSWAKPAWTYRTFELEAVPGGISLAGTTLVLRGDSISAHLDGAKKAVLMAATLGLELETRLRRLELTDMTASVILDAAATDCIEKACDQLEIRIATEAKTDGFFANFRFSPGYGDLPLDIQPTLLDVLDAGRAIGLTCTSSLIMIPRKSVTAVIGLFREPADASGKTSCGTCNMAASCPFRKSGKNCGHR